MLDPSGIVITTLLLMEEEKKQAEAAQKIKRVRKTPVKVNESMMKFGLGTLGAGLAILGVTKGIECLMSDKQKKKYEDKLNLGYLIGTCTAGVGGMLTFLA